MPCNRCNKQVKDDQVVVCRGYCGESFHAYCVNVDEPLRKQIPQYRKNLFWMCDGCAALFQNAHFRTMMAGFDEKISEVPAALMSMQGEIEKLQASMTALAAKVDGIPSTPTMFSSPNPWPAIHRTNRSSKRFRGTDGNSIDAGDECIKTGTKATTTVPSVRLAPRLDDELIWIYLSAFHPSTTEDQIASFVTECLELEANVNVKVIKLVSKVRDLNTLSFISFKVGLSGKFKEKALSSESWPEHIRFRQFEDDRPKNLPQIISLSTTARPEITVPSVSDSAMDV